MVEVPHPLETHHVSPSSWAVCPLGPGGGPLPQQNSSNWGMETIGSPTGQEGLSVSGSVCTSQHSSPELGRGLGARRLQERAWAARTFVWYRANPGPGWWKVLSTAHREEGGLASQCGYTFILSGLDEGTGAGVFFWRKP